MFQRMEDNQEEEEEKKKDREHRLKETKTQRKERISKVIRSCYVKCANRESQIRSERSEWGRQFFIVPDGLGFVIFKYRTCGLNYCKSSFLLCEIF